MKYLVAIGINSKGEIKEFKINDIGNLYCSHGDLVSLKIPEGVKEFYCFNNKLTELKLPKGLEYLDCGNNKISELNIPKDVRKIVCDRHVLGLDKVDWKCKIVLL